MWRILAFCGGCVFIPLFMGWKPPASAEPYLGAIRNTEKRYGIPENLLARLLYQESHFRHDIVTGKVISPAGALGIAQIIPEWHPGVDPLDTGQAIDYAGEYLRRLYDYFGTWSDALAAYNWGWGNMERQGFKNAPLETLNYVSSILGDVKV